MAPPPPRATPCPRRSTGSPRSTSPVLHALLSDPMDDQSPPGSSHGPLIGGPAASTIRNVARNALRPGYLGVMTRKLGTRFADRRHAARAPEAIEWAAASARDAGDLARAIDPRLWEEALRFGAGLEEKGRRVLET